MRYYHCTIIVAIVMSIIFHHTEAGPVRSIALAAAQRASKIPRSIRAPFINTELMTARGFGKRNLQFLQPLTLNRDNMPSTWGYVKSDSKYNMQNDHDSNGSSEEEIYNMIQTDRIPINWLVGELISNPELIRSILYKFVDTNKDGFLSSKELIQSQTSNEVNN